MDFQGLGKILDNQSRQIKHLRSIFVGWQSVYKKLDGAKSFRILELQPGIGSVSELHV